MPFYKGSPHINRNGRPKKGETFSDAIASVLHEKAVNYKGELITGKEAAARKLLELAISGDVNALKYLMDRVDGRPDVYKHIQNVSIPQIVIMPMDEEDEDAAE
jgi:hypothetical protein